MQPELPQQQNGGEVQPDISAPNLERMPILPAPETGLEVGLERNEQAAELRAAADASITALPLPPLPLDPVTMPIVDDATAANPLTAQDDDVIEKEWVDRAKTILSNTKDDPFERGKQVSSLQRDYLKKRYGKDLGATES